jgi:limonene-1,2-epoxide hydrolase
VKRSAEQELVRRFFERWAVSFDEMCAAFGETFSADCYWDQRPLAATTGQEPALRFLRRARWWMGLERVEVELLSIASSGVIVHTQRIDRLYARSGALLTEAPVCGVLEIAEQRIVAWKEYFDSAQFVGNTLALGTRRLAAAALRR